MTITESMGHQVARFTHEALPAGAEYEAVRFDEPWNGWVTPVVTQHVAAEVMEHLASVGKDTLAAMWDGLDLVVWNPELSFSDHERLSPDAAGLYHLGQLGFTFTETESPEQAVVSAAIEALITSSSSPDMYEDAEPIMIRGSERSPHARASMTDAVRVTEVVHHGDFQHATTATGGSLTEALKDVLQHSPYPSSHSDDSAWVTELWGELLNRGTASRGWCRYTWEWTE